MDGLVVAKGIGCFALPGIRGELRGLIACLLACLPASRKASKTIHFNPQDTLNISTSHSHINLPEFILRNDPPPPPFHKLPRRLRKRLDILDAQLHVQRNEAPLREVDVLGEHVVVEEGLEVRG